jgi:putative protease
VWRQPTRVCLWPESRRDPLPELTVLCRSVAQLKACAAEGIALTYLDLEDIAAMPTPSRGQGPNPACRFSSRPRAFRKPVRRDFFKLIERANPHGVLVRNHGAVAHFTALGIPTVGDFSLNVANPLTSRWFREQGLGRLTISCDLNIEQALDLLQGRAAGVVSSLSFTSTCRCSTWSIVSSQHSCPVAAAFSTAAGPASGTP